MSDMLTEKEVAAQLKVSPATVRRWRRSGKLPFVKLGRLVRFFPAAVEAFVAERTQ